MYSEETIKKASAIFYRLLKTGEVTMRSDPDMFDDYMIPEVGIVVRQMGESAGCIVEALSSSGVYMIPKDENSFLGFNKTELKIRLCKNGNATDAEYYLRLFIVLTIMRIFYSGLGISSKSRNFIKVADLVNTITQDLEAVVGNSENYVDEFEDESGLAIRRIKDVWDGLLATDSDRKNSKVGVTRHVVRFMRDQGLLSFVDSEDRLDGTDRMTSMMNTKILNRNNYNNIVRMFSDANEGACIDE